MVALIKQNTKAVAAHNHQTALSPIHTREVLLEFFDRIGIASHLDHSSSQDELDPIVAHRFLSIIDSWDLSLPRRMHMKYALLGLDMTSRAYYYAPVDVQVSIAIYMYLCVMVDDDVMSVDTLREFSPRFFAGLPQLHPILSRLVIHFTDMREHFTSFSANMIVTNTLEFFNAELFVRDEGGAEVYGPEASDYIDFMRWKNGVGEAFVMMIWPRAMFPETKTYIQAVP